MDRDDWIPLGELQQGEQLLGATGPAVILSRAILQRTTPVYNIEVHGEHVYEVGETSLLVHNSTDDCIKLTAEFAGKQAVVAPHLPAGSYPALVIEGQVFVARFHNVAYALAGKKGIETFYGFAQINQFGQIIKLFKL